MEEPSRPGSGWPARACVPAVVLALVGGCIPVGLPPLAVGGGGGVGTGKDGAEGTWQLDGTVRPLQSVGALKARPADFGVGVVAQGSRDATRYGPTVDGRWFPLDARVDESTRARLGVGLAARALWEDAHHVGPSAAFYVTGELAHWTDGDCGAATGSNSVLFGCYYGEAGPGLRAETSYAVIAGTNLWTVTLGLEFRTPLLLGILFFVPDK